MIKGDTQASLREYGWSEEQTLTKVMTEKPRLQLYSHTASSNPQRFQGKNSEQLTC